MISDKVLPKIKSGAMVRVWEKISAEGGSASGGKGGDKERVSKFEGLVLARKHGSEKGATFTVRATVLGVGVEKVFPIWSPRIEKLEVLSSPKKVGRSKIYYVRTLPKREIRRKLGAAAEKTLALPEEKSPVPVEKPAA